MRKLILEQNLRYFSHLDKFGSQDLIPWPSHASPSAPLKRGETLDMKNQSFSPRLQTWHQGIYLAIIEMRGVLVTNSLQDLRLFSELLVIPYYSICPKNSRVDNN